jgi:hypothetical protein
MSLVNEFEKTVRENFMGYDKEIILQYLREKCTEQPEYFKEITNSLYLGLNNIYENERKERIEIENASAVYMMATDEKGLKKLGAIAESLIDRLNLFKYINVQTEKDKLNRVLK